MLTCMHAYINTRRDPATQRVCVCIYIYVYIYIYIYIYTHTQGLIQLHNVQFTYASRPDTLVLKGVTLTASPNQKTALVGSSGSGKSTVVALIERFYNPTSGFITLDSVDIRDLNVAWLRKNIGYVAQEPVSYVYVCVCMYVYIHIYIYIYTVHVYIHTYATRLLVLLLWILWL